MLNNQSVVCVFRFWHAFCLRCCCCVCVSGNKLKHCLRIEIHGGCFCHFFLLRLDRYFCWVRFMWSLHPSLGGMKMCAAAVIWALMCIYCVCINTKLVNNQHFKQRMNGIIVIEALISAKCDREKFNFEITSLAKREHANANAIRYLSEWLLLLCHRIDHHLTDLFICCFFPHLFTFRCMLFFLRRETLTFFPKQFLASSLPLLWNSSI